MRTLFTTIILVASIGAMGQGFRIAEAGIIQWQYSFNGTPNSSSIITISEEDGVIAGKLNNYSVNYEAQGIEWRYLPIMLNDPLNAEVCIKITSDSTYTVTVSDVVFKITDINRGPIGQLADLEYYMLGFKGKKFKADPMLDEVRNILSRDFIRIFSSTK